MQEEVCEIFDHKNLNLDVREMQNIIPTAENILCRRLEFNQEQA